MSDYVISGVTSWAGRNSSLGVGSALQILGARPNPMDGTASTVRPITRGTYGTQVTPYITVVVLITGVLGGLILVISVILFCKYCIKKKNKVLRRRPCYNPKDGTAIQQYHISSFFNSGGSKRGTQRAADPKGGAERRPALLTRLTPSSWSSASESKSYKQYSQYETVATSAEEVPDDDTKPRSILARPRKDNTEDGEENIDDLDIDAVVALYKEGLKQVEDEEEESEIPKVHTSITPSPREEKAEQEVVAPNPTFLLVTPTQPKDERDRRVSFLKLDRRSSAGHWTSKHKSRRRYTEGDFHHLKLMRIERPVPLPKQRTVACTPFEQKRDRHEALLKKRSHSVFDDRATNYYRHVLRRSPHYYDDGQQHSPKLRRDAVSSNRERLASTRPEISDSPSPPTKAHHTEVAAEVHREASNGSASSRGSIHSMKDLGPRRDSINKLEVKDHRELRQLSFSGKGDLPYNHSSNSLVAKNELLQVRGNSFSGKTDHMRGSNSLKVKTEFSQARSRSSGYLGKENSISRSNYSNSSQLKIAPLASGQLKANSFERPYDRAVAGSFERGAFERPSFSFDRHSASSFERQTLERHPGIPFDRHSASSFERHTLGSSFDRHSASSFERQTLERQSAAISFDRHSASSFERQTLERKAGSSFDRHSASSFERQTLERPGSSFERQTLERPGNSFERKTLDMPGSSFERQTLERPGNSFERKTLDMPGSSFERQTLERPGNSFDRHLLERQPSISYDRHPSFDRQNGHQLYDRPKNTIPYERQIDPISVLKHPPKTLDTSSTKQSHSLEVNSPTEKLSVAVLKSRKVKSYDSYIPDMDADRFEITQLRCDSSCVADLDLLGEDGSPELRSKVRYNDMGSFEDVSHEPYKGGGFEMEEVTVESSDTETLNGSQVYRELWNLRSTLEEEEDFSDTIRMEDMSSPDSQANADRDGLNPIAGSSFDAKQEANMARHRKGDQPVTTASSNLLHPNYENRRQTFRNILSKRLKKIDAPLSTDNSFDSVETMDTDGEVSEDTTSRHEVTTTSFESTTDNTDSTGDSHNQRLQLQQMRGDSGYKSLETQQTIYLPTTPPKIQKAHVGPNVDDGLSIDVPFVPAMAALEDEQRDSPSGSSTIEQPSKSQAGQKKCSFERNRARTASKKRREYGRERQAMHIYETIVGEAETDSKSDHLSGESFDENQTPSKLSLFTRFFKSHSMGREKRPIVRDYSIDEKSNELFNEFSRFDPKMEPRSSKKTHIYNRNRLQRKQDSVTEFEYRRAGKLRPERRSASLGSDSSASSVRRLSPQDSIEEEDFEAGARVPLMRKSSLPGFDCMPPRVPSRLPASARDIPIIRLPEEDPNEVV